MLKNISAKEAQELINKEDVLVLDVRSKEEYLEGHIPGAVLIPAQDLPRKIDDLDDYRDKPIIVYCSAGGRSPIAVNLLIENDFENINHLSRGIASWNYPLEK